MRKLIILFLLASCNVAAHAGYAQVTPPSNWTPSSPGKLATITKAASAANSDAFQTAGKISVAGKMVTVPANLRFSTNMPRYAAAALYLHPALRFGVAAASWIGAAALLYDVSTGEWSIPNNDPPPLAQVSDGTGYVYCYRTDGGIPPSDCAPGVVVVRTYSRDEAIDGYIPICLNGYTSCVPQPAPSIFIDIYNQSGQHLGAKNIGRYPLPAQNPDNCPAGWYVINGGCVETPTAPQVDPLTQEEFIDEITKNPMPVELPDLFPEPLPVELPQLEPMFVPSSDPKPNPAYTPVPNPAYDPEAPAGPGNNPHLEPTPENAPYIQPGVEIRPAPTPLNPWQVETIPVNRPIPQSEIDPSAFRDPASLAEPGAGGGGTGSEPLPPPLPPSDTEDLCEKHPEIIACQVLDEPEDPGLLPEKEQALDFEPMTGFSGSGSCPAPVVVEVAGHSIAWEWDGTCSTLATGKPLFLAFAWLFAAFILIGKAD